MTTSGEIERKEAKERWHRDVYTRYLGTDYKYIGVLGLLTPEVEAAVTDAELKKAGDGVEKLINIMPWHLQP